MPAEPTTRFSGRVENYIKYRPRYPEEIVCILETECGMTRDSIVADIGAGTGIFSELLLRYGATVVAVEPNRAMRDAATRALQSFPRFTAIAGTAEATTLPPHSVDIATAAQAFHWFDPPKARIEFMRILRPHGWAALLWNLRRTKSTPFLRAYERLLREFGTDYAEVSVTYMEQQSLEIFFGNQPFATRTLEQTQRLSFDGVRGRLLSSSYIPDASHPRYDEMLRALRTIFDDYQTGGTVEFEYDVKIVYSRLSP